MKVIFIAASCSIVYLMKFKSPYKGTYDKNADDAPVLYIVVPCFLLALVLNEYFSFSEVLYSFSIYLEAVAIVPQLWMVHKEAALNEGFVDLLSSHYMFCLGGYRACYVINWVWRYYTEPGYRHWIIWTAGVVQTLIYCDFFYYYILAMTTGQKMALPI